MSGYTKGPWSIRPGVFNYQTEIMSGKDVLATVYGNTGENLGNANVMAAAPDLLEALVGMLEIYGVREQHIEREPFASSTEVECCNAARAAIAKAKREA